MDEIFRLSGVSYAYLRKYPALCGVDLEIPKGKRSVLLGANGTGKSTLLQMLDGLIFPDSGSVIFDGKPLTEKNLEDEEFSRWFRRKTGFVFQNSDVQLFCPTVREDIAFGPLQFGAGPEEAAGKAEEYAQRLGIAHLLERSSHQLSVGEKRKVAIASTLVIEPEVLLFDEPTAGLDPATTRHIIDIIAERCAAGVTVVTATHDLHLVEEIADKVFVLGQERRIVRSGACREVLGDLELLAGNNLVHLHSHHHGGTVHTHAHQHLEHHHGHDFPEK